MRPHARRFATGRISTSSVSSASCDARARMLPFGSHTNDAPQNSRPASTPVRFTAATNRPLAIAWLRIIAFLRGVLLRRSRILVPFSACNQPMAVG